MSPSFPLGYSVNSAPSYSKTRREFRSLFSVRESCADIMYLLRGECGFGVCLSSERRSRSGKVLSTFGNHVVKIILERSNKQMTRIHARRIVAGVADNPIALISCVFKSISHNKTVSRYRGSVYLEHSVPASIAGRSPNPAPAVEAFYVTPEPIIDTHSVCGKDNIRISVPRPSLVMFPAPPSRNAFSAAVVNCATHTHKYTGSLEICQ